MRRDSASINERFSRCDECSAEDWRVDRGELSPEQQRRQDEADAFIADSIYEGRLIEKTVQGYSGMLYDYIKVLGHFPAAVFTTLNKGACRAHVYGEVYNPNPQKGWVKTEMGSGQFSTGALVNVAWARQIRYFDATWAFANEPQTDNFVYWSKPYATQCYDRSPLVNQGSAGPIMYLGGPGGLDPACAQKMPSP